MPPGQTSNGMRTIKTFCCSTSSCLNHQYLFSSSLHDGEAGTASWSVNDLGIFLIFDINLCSFYPTGSPRDRLWRSCCSASEEVWYDWDRGLVVGVWMCGGRSGLYPDGSTIFLLYQSYFGFFYEISSQELWTGRVEAAGVQRGTRGVTWRHRGDLQPLVCGSVVS